MWIVLGISDASYNKRGFILIPQQYRHSLLWAALSLSDPTLVPMRQ
jgi:hypothetical protein